MSNSKLRYIFFWSSIVVGYILPIVYYVSKSNVVKKEHASTFVTMAMPIIAIGIILILKLCTAIPKWVASWKPSFTKGIVKSIPIYLVAIVAITLGLFMKKVVDKGLTTVFNYYFEFIIVFFGSLCISSILNAFHLKYKELDLMEKGYVLGVVNKG